MRASDPPQNPCSAKTTCLLRRRAAATTPKREDKSQHKTIGGGATLRRRGQTNHRGPARSNAVCNNARSSRAKSSPPSTFS